MIRVLIFLTLLLAGAGVQAIEPGDHEFSLSHGSRQRSYILHVPRLAAQPTIVRPPLTLSTCPVT